jgi:hypothetical protein
MMGYDPLPYKENTNNSLITVKGKIDPATFRLTPLTPEVCSNPRIGEGQNFVNTSITYVFFDTKASGMCRIQIVDSINQPQLTIEAPVKNWPVSMLDNLLKFTGPNNYGKNPVGTVVKASPINFYYPMDQTSTSKLTANEIAPVYITNLNPTVCSQKNGIEFTGISSGVCKIQVGWDGFGFGSKYFPGKQFTYDLFTSQTAADVAADKAAADAASATQKANSALAAAKAKADAKLCKPADQSKLLSYYAPLQKINSSYSDYNQTIQRINYLISQTGSNQTIQLSSSEFPDLLRAYPVINGVRQVPLYVYQAILQGTLQGISNNYTIALNTASLAYKSASAGCKKVVGPPK